MTSRGCAGDDVTVDDVVREMTLRCGNEDVPEYGKLHSEKLRSEKLRSGKLCSGKLRAETCICVMVMRSRGINGSQARSVAVGRDPPPVHHHRTRSPPRAILTMYT